MTNEEKMTEAEYQETLKLAGDTSAETNKTKARIELENEEYLLQHGEKAIDLSLIPQDQHHLYDQRQVTVPKEVSDFLADCEYPLSEDAIHMIEKKINRSHNIAAPHGISMCVWIQQTGKPRAKLSQLVTEGIWTGFEYLHKK